LGRIFPAMEAADRVLEELAALEPLFHRPETGTGREAVGALIGEDFWEVGESGRRYEREFVIDAVLAREGGEEDAWDCEGFRCEELAPDTFLLTYLLVRPRGRSRRMTIWQRAADGRWRARYHQGTPAPPTPSQAE
jgi:hypothetical protein